MADREARLAHWQVFQGGDEHVADLGDGITIAAIREPSGRWKAGVLGNIIDNHTYDTVDGARTAAIAQAQMILDRASAGLRKLVTN